MTQRTKYSTWTDAELLRFLPPTLIDDPFVSELIARLEQRNDDLDAERALDEEHAEA
jgi:hypothetical protein